MERPPNCAFLAQCTTITVKRSYSGQCSYPPSTVAARVTNEEEVIMYKYRVSVDDFGIRGHGAVGMELPSGEVNEYEISPGSSPLFPRIAFTGFLT